MQYCVMEQQESKKLQIQNHTSNKYWILYLNCNLMEKNISHPDACCGLVMHIQLTGIDTRNNG